MHDLNMSGVQYNIVSSIFFVTYVTFGAYPPYIQIAEPEKHGTYSVQRGRQQLDTRELLLGQTSTLGRNNLHFLGDCDDNGIGCSFLNLRGMVTHRRIQHGVVQNYRSLVALRLLMGILESGKWEDSSTDDLSC